MILSMEQQKNSQPSPAAEYDEARVTGSFAQVYDAHLERIYRFHFYRTRHRETAQDLTSQTFLKALEAFKRFDATRASAATWLYRIARNALIDHLRAQRTNDDLDVVAEILPSAVNVASDVETKQALEKASALLTQLTPEQREIVLLRLWDDMSYAEIAEITGKNESACKMAFSRGMAALRKHAGPLAALFLLIPIFHS